MNIEQVSISITKEQLSQLPVVSYPGKIQIINTDSEAVDAFKQILMSKTVGIDTETRPSFKKGHINSVALIQIATEHCCYLFRISKFGLTQCLVDFLQNTRITKIGLSLRDDFHVLHRLAPFEPQAFIDLQAFVKNYSITDASLQKIFAIIFGQRISKHQRLSNWEADTLTPQQQQYASIDAWACLQIYKHLKTGKFNPGRSPYISTTG